MIFFSIIAAASLSMAPLDPASERDLRCVAALADTISKTTVEKQISVNSIGLFYFVGKMDGRHHGLDLGPQLYRLITQSDISAKMSSELDRCRGELGQRATEMGAAAQQLEKASK